MVVLFIDRVWYPLSVARPTQYFPLFNGAGLVQVLLDLSFSSDLGNKWISTNGKCTLNKKWHVKEYPTMHYFEIPRRTQSMIAYKILTEYLWEFRL